MRLAINDDRLGSLVQDVHWVRVAVAVVQDSAIVIWTT